MSIPHVNAATCLGAILSVCMAFVAVGCPKPVGVNGGGQIKGSNGQNLDNYLTKDGNLTNPLIISEYFVADMDRHGISINVEQDGKWSATRLNLKGYGKGDSLENVGSLTKDEIATLATALAKFDLLGLKDHVIQSLHPDVTTISFGNAHALLSLRKGASPTDELSPQHRFFAIVGVVRELTTKKSSKE